MQVLRMRHPFDSWSDCCIVVTPKICVQFQRSPITSATIFSLSILGELGKVFTRSYSADQAMVAASFSRSAVPSFRSSVSFTRSSSVTASWSGSGSSFCWCAPRGSVSPSCRTSSRPHYETSVVGWARALASTFIIIMPAKMPDISLIIDKNRWYPGKLLFY